MRFCRAGRAGVRDRSRLDREWRASCRPVKLTLFQAPPLDRRLSRVCPRPEAGEVFFSHANRLRSARPVSAGSGVAPQRRNFARSHGFGDARAPRLFQFPVDPQGCPVSPADHGQPSQGTRECDQRRHRSILVHSSRPLKPHCRASRGGPQSGYAGRNGAAGPSQNPNLAQMARVSSAEITSSGRPPIPSNWPSAEAPADLRPRRPDSIPAAGAITGVFTLSP
jgi:hypothetical protein